MPHKNVNFKPNYKTYIDKRANCILNEIDIHITKITTQ